MQERIAELVWLALAAYAGAGLMVALVLLFGGIGRIDRLAAGAPVRVKLLLLPGLTALWPAIVWRLLGGRPPEDRNEDRA